jgi:hypothetical protein
MQSTARRWKRQRSEPALPLFDVDERPPPPSRNVPTSRAAAASVADARELIETRVLGHLAAAGDRGATAEETAIALGLRMQTASARFSELKDAGRIVKTMRTRATSSGRQAAVFVHPNFAGGQEVPCDRAS